MVFEQILTFIGLVSADVATIAYFFIYLLKKKNFLGKYVDVKEAPLNINNTLKDEDKRLIIRSLRHEKKYLTLIAREVGESVAKTTYHLKELENMGIIGSMKLSREKFFLLTKKGQWCLDAIHIYYPKNNLEKLTSTIRIGKLKWNKKMV
jgi:DNA-binding transcriptional ArsR family regulator